ncbi:hypothetical protein ABB02_00648 [Clostridiaceae bacterium JG1575]|nr:hypothetical protein ABB02_00648 [Clostridiaceae bacterium JG1575]
MKNKPWTLLLVAVLLIAALVQFANQRVRMDRILRETKEQEARLQELKKENTRLQHKVQELHSPEYLEKQARERLKMIKPGEVPIEAPGSASKPSSQPAPPQKTKP